VLELEKSHDRYDVVLLDQAMPHKTGAQVLHTMRERGYALPVVATSGYTEAEPEAEDWQPDAFLPKPFTLANLNEALGKALRTSERHPL